MYKLWSML